MIREDGAQALDGAIVVALLHDLGVEDWRGVQSVEIGTHGVTVRYALRDGKGRFYADDNGDVASRTLSVPIAWPKDGAA